MPITGWIHDSAWKGAAGPSVEPVLGDPVVPVSAPIAHQDPATKEQIHALFSAIQTSLSYVLYAMVCPMHVAGALKHQFRDRKPELQRNVAGA